jgi:SnoaL-like domain
MNKLIFFIAFSLMATVIGTSCTRSEDELIEETTITGDLPNTAEFAIVNSFVEAINNQDRAAARALLAPDAGYAYGDGALRTGQSFDNWLESDLYGPNARIVIESATQNGNQVNMLGRWGRNGNTTNRADYRFVVRDGLIQSWRLY